MSQNLPFPAVLIGTLSANWCCGSLDPDQADLGPKLFDTDGILQRIFKKLILKKIKLKNMKITQWAKSN